MPFKWQNQCYLVKQKQLFSIVNLSNYNISLLNKSAIHEAKTI